MVYEFFVCCVDECVRAGNTIFEGYLRLKTSITSLKSCNVCVPIHKKNCISNKSSQLVYNKPSAGQHQ